MDPYIYPGYPVKKAHLSELTLFQKPKAFVYYL